ncbi:pentapeptide repeat-containing protein [Methylobacterium komagatae]|uniref:Pentapeptide repeat-containing protein n=1 Tax=Methylobacterium komagatae TaxID=374425 RepID=A0ABW2BLI2_9HYPH
MRERAHTERTLSRRSDVYLFPKEFAAIGADNRADLRGTCFASANLYGADLADARLTGADLADANLGRTLFEVASDG